MLSRRKEASGSSNAPAKRVTSHSSLLDDPCLTAALSAKVTTLVFYTKRRDSSRAVPFSRRQENYESVKLVEKSLDV